METVWHYTTGEKYKLIAADGVLRPAESSAIGRERPLVWFSANKYWEQTANKGIAEMVNGRTAIRTMGKEETATRCGGLVRVGVEKTADLLSWPQIKSKARYSSRVVRELAERANQQGSEPLDWWGCFDAVPRSRWVAVQFFDGGEWRDMQ